MQITNVIYLKDLELNGIIITYITYFIPICNGLKSERETEKKKMFFSHIQINQFDPLNYLFGFVNGIHFTVFFSLFFFFLSIYLTSIYFEGQNVSEQFCWFFSLNRHVDCKKSSSLPFHIEMMCHIQCHTHTHTNVECFEA